MPPRPVADTAMPSKSPGTLGDRRVLLSAFALHAGGGAVVLNETIVGLGPEIKVASIDWRIANDIKGLEHAEVEIVPSRLFSRVRALVRLAKAGQPGDRLFCLNSLPPPVRSRARTVVFVHSPQFARLTTGIEYPAKVWLRMKIDQALFAWGRRNIDEIWVQSESMARAMRLVAPNIAIAIVPFVDQATLDPAPLLTNGESGPVRYFYPADEMAHKNHLTLLKAWRIVADGGCDAQLHLTLLDPAFGALASAAGVADLVGTKIINHGRMSRSQVLQTLRQSTGLVFPSLTETFGLPLVEARAQGVPIIASERDFVRDVCEPVQTFDPLSAVSIARAIRRHLGVEPSPPHPGTGATVAARLLA